MLKQAYFARFLNPSVSVY